MKHRWVLILLVVLAIGAGVTLKVAMPHGLTVWSVDSVVYLDSAKNVLAGKGYIYNGPWAAAHTSLPEGAPIPLTHYPPFYPLVLVASSHLAGEPLGAAYWISIIALGLAGLVAGLVVREATPERPSNALLAALLVALNPIVLKLYTNPLSEVIYMPMALAGQWALLRFSKSGKLLPLCIAALLLGLGCITRYSGVVWVGTAGLWLLLWGADTLWRRLKLATLFGAIAGVPLALFVIRNHFVSGAAADRDVRWHPIGIEHWLDSTMALSSWFLPWRWMGTRSGIAIAVLCFLLALACYLLSRRYRFAEESSGKVFRDAYRTTVIFLVAYVLHLMVSISLTDYSTPLDSRILLPVLIWMLCLVAMIPAVLPGGLWKGIATAACAVLVLVSAGRSLAWVKFNRQVQSGYLAPEWMQSKTAEAIRHLPASAVVFSNRAEQVYFSLNRPAVCIPDKYDPMSLAPNKKADSIFAKMHAALEKTGGLVVRSGSIDFADAAKRSEEDAVPWSDLQEYPLAELQQILPLKRVFEDKPWEVFVIAPAEATK